MGVVGVYAPDVLHGCLAASTTNIFRWVAGERRKNAMSIPRGEFPPPKTCSSIKPFEKNRSEMSKKYFAKNFKVCLVQSSIFSTVSIIRTKLSTSPAWEVGILYSP